MKQRFFFFLMAMLVVILAACGNSGGGQSSGSKSSSTSQKTYQKSNNKKQGSSASSDKSMTTIQVLKNSKVGNYLADGKGMSLYYYKKDKPSVSNCTGGCLHIWPAFYGNTKNLKIPSGYKKSNFGTITRKDTGKKQITYKGYPLYYYAPDKQKGDVKGQDVGEVWYVVNSKTNFKGGNGQTTDQTDKNNNDSNGNGSY